MTDPTILSALRAELERQFDTIGGGFTDPEPPNPTVHFYSDGAIDLHALADAVEEAVKDAGQHGAEVEETIKNAAEEFANESRRHFDHLQQWADLKPFLVPKKPDRAD